MTRWMLAAAALLGSAAVASADYVIIIANVGAQTTELKTQPGMGMMGAAGGQPMMPGGIGPPGLGAGGGMGPGMMGMGGMQGMRGGMQGMRGGMQGMRGGMMMGMGGGRGGMMMGGMMGMMGGMMGAAPDVDDVPYFIVAVVEVESAGGDLYKKLKEDGVGFAKVKLPEKLGKSCQLLRKTTFAETHLLTQDNHKPLPTVLRQFNDKFGSLKDKPKAEDILEVADWTLSHGLVDKFPQVMDKLVEVDKSHPAAVAYVKIKAELDRPAKEDEASKSWRKRLLPGSREVESAHYILVYKTRTAGSVEVQSHLQQLENSLRGFYYWFALKHVALPVPPQRQLVVMTGQDSDFRHLQKVFTSGPIVVDGFFARRENVAVMASERQDESYDSLKKFWKKWEDKGFDREKLLGSNPKSGVPRAIPIQRTLDYAEPQMVALMLKALEQEAELATISHDTSRQLLFSSGLLPRNVAVPEWLLFGMGSFFETPLQSPWASIGAPSPYYLPRWNDLKGKGFEKTKGDTLRKVITDAYFHHLPAEGAADSPARHLHDAALRRARTASWSLTYFLARQKLDGLRKYFIELSKMPRDIALDDEILLGCFARAFGQVDVNNKVDKRKLDAFANEWFSNMENVHFDSENTMKEIREIFRKKLAESHAADNEKAGQGGAPGGLGVPGGFNPPGGNGRRRGGGNDNQRGPP